MSKCLKMSKKKKPKKRSAYRVRIAPSPTGFLHVGTARTALFNWLFAKHHAGSFIVRIEDTDRERSRSEFEKNILAGLDWLGLKPDEFYRQSERTKIYQRRLQKLLDQKKAFWCRHSPAELTQEKEEQAKRKEPPRHICQHKKLELGGQKSEKGIIRLAVDENSTRIIYVDDLIRGRIEFAQQTLGDLSLAKDEQTPLYNLAAAVDDIEMKISHVIRGEDHLANTPKQILITEALGATPPQYAHLPLILNEDRSKLSKREGAENFTYYEERGYLPEAVANFLALLGWSPLQEGREILSKSDLVDQFSLERVHKSGAIFDLKKLNWLNAQHLKMFNNAGWAKILQPFIKKHFGSPPAERVLKAAPLFRERIEYLDQVREFHYLFREPNYDSTGLIWKKSSLAQTAEALQKINQLLPQSVKEESFDEHAVRQLLDQIAQESFGGDRGAVYWPLRVALTGEKFSPDPVQIMAILKKEEVLARIHKAILNLKENKTP